MGINYYKIKCSRLHFFLHQPLPSDLPQIQSATLPVAPNTSTQTPKKLSMTWTTSSHTSVWTETSKDPSRIFTLLKVSSSTTGLESTKINMLTQPRKLTTTSPQNLMVTSLTPKPTWQLPKRDSTTPTNCHELVIRPENGDSDTIINIRMNSIYLSSK